MSHYCWFALGMVSTTAAATPQTLLIDPAQSHFAIAVKATVGSFVGTLAHYAVTISVDPESHRVGEVVFAFDFADLQTGNVNRNHDMLGWAQVAKFPEGHFTLAKLEPLAGRQMQARGQLSLHGRSQEITFPVSISQENGRYTIEGDARLDTRDFGLPILHSYWVLTVDPIVHVQFHLFGILPGR